MANELNPLADDGRTNQYTYKLLDPRHNEIRVLRPLEPFKIGALLNCTLSNVSLDATHSYDALSYTWGDQTKDHGLNRAILLDGTIFPITRNLESALQKLLLGNDSKPLWVDAVCINQADIHERNEQVQKMKFVYQRASQVLSWLGEEYENSTEAFESLREILTVGVKPFIHKGPAPWTIETLPSDKVVRKILAIIQLFSREYWWRCWIVQEVTFARRLKIHCGPDSMIWEDLNSATKALVAEANWVDYALNSTSIAHMSWKLADGGPSWIDRSGYSIKDRETPSEENKLHNSDQNEESNVELGKLLIFHQRKRATDPRDKIFSLLSFISERKQKILPVDYRLNTRSIYIQVATFLISTEKSLAALTENKQPPEDTEKEGGFNLPSWVPYCTFPYSLILFVPARDFSRC